jgi:TetR/AcrR family tetracycline transcriptional repressor
MALDPETIVREALELLKAEGAGGVTFRKLTARLGVQAPAIYWRFKSKQELQEAMAEAILAEKLRDLAPHQGDGPWQDWFAGLLRKLRVAMLAYPDGARVVTGARPMSAPTLGTLAEYALRAAEEAGHRLPDAAAMVFTAIHFTFGRVIEEQDSTGASTMDEQAATAFAASYPTIARVLTSARQEGHTAAQAFDAGLSLILRQR